MTHGRARSVFYASSVIAAAGIVVMTLATDGAPGLFGWSLVAVLAAFAVNLGAALVIIVGRVRRKAQLIEKALSGRVGPDDIAPSDRMPL